MNMHESGFKTIAWLVVAALLALVAIAATMDVEDHSESAELKTFCTHDYC